MAGGAVGSGVKEAELPDLGKMFEFTANQLANGQSGLSVDEENQPQLSPEEMLNLIWPLAKQCFTGDFKDQASAYRPAPMKYWPLISGYVANQYIQEIKDVLDPVTAVTICMESAIRCSKVVKAPRHAH